MSQPLPGSASLPPIEAGSILAGKYRVARLLGQGGMGLVVEARHIALDERVALKFLLPEYASHPEAAGRFLREARAAVKIKSEHVARVSDVGTLETGAPYMVMEYLDGSDLSNVLEKHGVFAVEDAVDYVIQGCEAIAEAHSYGIVHRDLKPANLFLTKHTDGSPLVKVLDFGISKVNGGDGVESLTRTTAAMGSALYMSPEQMQQTRSVDHRTDIYALGVALFEMLAGKQPFYAETLPQLCAEILTGTPTPIRECRPDLSEPFAAALEKAYARDRASRYQSVAEFVNALAPFAPKRSQGVIDRIARMAGIAPINVGPQQATAALPLGARGTEVIRGSQPSSDAIHPGNYQAPMSANSAAAFATGSNPGFPAGSNPGFPTGSNPGFPTGSSPGLARTGAGTIPTSNTAPIVIGVVLVALLGVAGGAFYFLRHKEPPPVVEATSTTTAPPPPSVPVPAPVPTPVAVPTAPTTPASAAPTASETAEVKTPLPSSHQPPRHVTPPPGAATAKVVSPPATANPGVRNNVFDGR